MKRLILSLSLLLLGACGTPQIEYVRGPERVVYQMPKHTQGKAPLYRYDRTVIVEDTAFVYHASPDQGFVFCYVYAKKRLSHIDVFDYAGETPENMLDFLPKFYQIAVPGGM